MLVVCVCVCGGGGGGEHPLDLGPSDPARGGGGHISDAGVAGGGGPADPIEPEV